MKQLATATLIALLLSVFNVNAKETSKKDLNGDITSTILATDENLSDKTNQNSTYINNEIYLQESEASLELESWMVETESQNSDLRFAEEIDNALTIEKWMIPHQAKHRKRFIIEPPLKIESWMTDLARSGNTYKV